MAKAEVDRARKVRVDRIGGLLTDAAKDGGLVLTVVDAELGNPKTYRLLRAWRVADGKAATGQSAYALVAVTEEVPE